MDPKTAELRSALDALGWTQSQGAAYCATTEASFSRWYNGKAPVSESALRLLRQRLGRPIDDPFDPEAPMTLRDAPRDPRWLSVWEEDALTVLGRIEPEARTQLIAALRGVIQAEDVRRTRSSKAAVSSADIVAQKVAALTATDTVPGSSAAPPIEAPAPQPSSDRRPRSHSRPRRDPSRTPSDPVT